MLFQESLTFGVSSRATPEQLQAGYDRNPRASLVDEVFLGYCLNQKNISVADTMKIIRLDEKSTTPEKSASVTVVGNFDGVHLGHEFLLAETVRLARAESLAPVVVTFEPSPRIFFAGRSDADKPLTSGRDKLAFFEKIGLARAVILPFDQAMASLSPEEFSRKFLVNLLGAKGLVAGYDFRIGAGRTGTAPAIVEIGRQLGFWFRQLEPLMLDGRPVSSTRIRELLRLGQVEEAARLLGRPYSFAGLVVRGEGRGRRLGAPTANLEGIEVMLPAAGVYAAWAITQDGRRFRSAVSLGDKPTFCGSFTLEAHLLDFSGDLLGQPLTLELAARIRAQARFDSAQALAGRIRADLAQAACLLGA